MGWKVAPIAAEVCCVSGAGCSWESASCILIRLASSDQNEYTYKQSELKS